MWLQANHLIFLNLSKLRSKSPRRKKKLLEIINTCRYNKVAGYKVNIKISVEFLYTNNKISEREMRKTIPFITTTNRLKYLDINLTKEVKDLYAEN